MVAGATWTLVIARAPWAARSEHTSVIDAAGAIYVVGGRTDYIRYSDVWASTDGGKLDWWGTRGYSGGFSEGATKLLRRYLR